MAQSQPGYGSDENTDRPPLVGKDLARYSAKFTVFHELLQYSDDAGCDIAEIRFETATFLGLDPEAEMNTGPPDIETTHVTQWTFKNYGKLFTLEDYPQRPGVFGVDLLSVFSVTERPCVWSGDKEVKFWWDNEDQLRCRHDEHPETVVRDLLTTFKLPLRKTAPMPPISELLQFLASSITFMVHLKEVIVVFDHHPVGRINKTLGQYVAIPIPRQLERSSPQKNMFVKSVQQYPITMKASIMRPRRDSVQAHETKLNLTVFTAEVDVTADEKLSQELYRRMKKNPPSRLKYTLIYTGKDEYDQSRLDEQKYLRELPSPFQGLRADLDGATYTRLYIGHATVQTTGVGGHMASHFIPCIDHESIDLVDNISTWNRELLYVGGFLCRVVYQLELSAIQSSWEEATTGGLYSRPCPELQDQFRKHFLHVLKFFTFHRSTPLPEVAQLLADSFYGCSTLPLMFLSSVGVRGAPDIRMFDPLCAKFLKSLPMLSEHVTRHGARFFAALPDDYKIPVITLSDTLRYLRHHTLDVAEVVACLHWWITLGGDNSTSGILLDTATIRGAAGPIPLSSITCFIDPKVLGLHIASGGPLPLSLIPLTISKHFSYEELSTFGWKEFTVVSWLQHISRPDVMSADRRYDFTRSVDWASRVLSCLCRVWSQLSENMRSEARGMFRNKPCIPTSKGLCCPDCSYLPTADSALFLHLDLPIVIHDLGSEVDEDMKRFLLSIGVRKDLPVQFLLHQLSTGDWTLSNLVDYLIQEESSLTSEDFSVLVSSEVIGRESSKEDNTYHRLNELYPPVDIFRRLRLPVIEWSEKREWRDTSPEVQLLYHLGLHQFPPLQKIMELCSSGDVRIQNTAFVYLCSNLHSQYQNYKLENFQDVEFIPVENKGCTSSCLKKLGEVYIGTQWKALGFFVIQDQYLSAPLQQLGIRQHPPTSKILDLLKETPPCDSETAHHWFGVLSNHLAAFSPLDLNRLSGLPIIPTGPLDAPKILPPAKCYLDQGPRPALYAKLFVFVDFSTEANYFLSACGLKNKVSMEDIAEVLIENPKRFFMLAGGYEGFLVELRKIAYQSHSISNSTLHKMSHKSALLGVCQKKTQGQAGWDCKYQFLTSQEIVVVNDSEDYQLFSDCLFVAPQEEVIERFYALLGCSRLSGIITKRCDLHEIPATTTCLEVQSLLLERLPFFLEKCTGTSKHKVTLPSSPLADYLKVKACNRILVSTTLVTTGRKVEQTRKIWAIARYGSHGDCIELWVSETAKHDMNEIAASLCQLLFETGKNHATLLLKSILSMDLEALKQRDFLGWSCLSHQ